MNPSLSDGDRVVMLIKPEYWTSSGRLPVARQEIRAVGLGDLLARIERLSNISPTKDSLLRTGRSRCLSSPERSVSSADATAQQNRDVVENAVRRWPAIEFEMRQVAVQGKTAASAVTSALVDLDADPSVDVIVITRGGGSVEDLLPFSDETLVRAAAEAQTPIVSAIGHEQDAPLLDYVADVRASTPTDAAMRVVPDLREQA